MTDLPARFALLPLLALLAACDNSAPMADDDAARAASGEVLEGSISDDMLPLQDLRSQPPIAPPLPGEVVAAPVGGSTPAPAASAGAETEAPAPAEEPASEPAAPE